MNRMEDNDFDRDVFIREMTADDIDAVYDIAVRSFSMPWSRESFAYSVETGSDYCIVAVADGNMAGYVILRCSFDTADVADVAVDDRFRGKGIGSRLMAQVLKHGGSVGISQYVLEVRQTNMPAMALYKKFGFIKEGIRKNYYSNPIENAVIMWKNVHPAVIPRITAIQIS